MPHRAYRKDRQRTLPFKRVVCAVYMRCRGFQSGYAAHTLARRRTEAKLLLLLLLFSYVGYYLADGGERSSRGVEVNVEFVLERQRHEQH